MDSKTVSREIRRWIWPLLQAAAFETFSTHTARRHGADKIDVVNFSVLQQLQRRGHGHHDDALASQELGKAVVSGVLHARLFERERSE